MTIDKFANMVVEYLARISVYFCTSLSFKMKGKKFVKIVRCTFELVSRSIALSSNRQNPPVVIPM